MLQLHSGQLQPLPGDAAAPLGSASAPAHVWTPSAASDASLILKGERTLREDTGSSSATHATGKLRSRHSRDTSHRTSAASDFHRPSAAAARRCTTVKGSSRAARLTAAVLLRISANASATLPAALASTTAAAGCDGSWEVLPRPGAAFPDRRRSFGPVDVRVGIDLRGGVGGGKGQVTSEPPAWLSPLFKPWSRMLCAAAAVAAAAAAPAHEVATVVCVRIVVRPRLPGHAVALIGSTSCGAQITTGTAQLRSAPATLVLPAPLNVASPTPVSPVSLHSLLRLVLGAPPPMRARLFRMLLSLPFPAIVRASQAAHDRLEAAKGAAEAHQAVDADPPFAPWSVKLVPDRHPECGARLVVTVRGQLQQQTAGSLGDKSASSFASRLCLNESDEDGEEGDSTGGDIEADASASATPASPSPYDVHLAEMWSALASQLAPLDTASGVAPTASGGVTTPATVSSGAPPASAFVHASGRFSLVAHAVGSGALPLLLA